jgi:hypothetical protein
MKTIKNPIRIIRQDKTILVSKAFLKRANLFGTEESKMLEDARSAYSDFKVVPRSITKSKTVRPHLKLSYAYMERYIATHEKAKERMEEYKEIRFKADCQSKAFSKVKEWFVACYTEIDDFTPEDYEKTIKKSLSNLELITPGDEFEADLSCAC